MDLDSPAASAAASATPKPEASASKAPAPAAPAAAADEALDEMLKAPKLAAPRKWHPGMSDSAPPNKGNKTYPVGAKGCLTDAKNVALTFVITGTLDSLEREECEALIAKYGGRTTGSVSGKTNYVIQGTDERGMPFEGGKVQKARNMANCKIIDEDGLLEIIRASAPQPAAALPSEKPAAPSSAAAKSSVSAGASASQAAPASLPALPKTEGAEALWAEKYRPENVQHLVGNNEHVRRLLQWLKSWEAEAARLARDGEKPSKGQETFHKAALLSGPPGVGKTSTAKVVLAQMGYDVVELNASDTRSEKAIKAMAHDMVGNTSIADFATAAGAGGKKASNGKMALIMDEVDGMSAGDRGGMPMLIKILAESRMPIICICNDRQAQKIKSLANHCLDLRFRRPTNIEIKGALRRVVAAEGYANVDEAVLERLADSCNSDIRQMLNLLQIWRPRDGSALTAGGVAANMQSAFKDLSVGPFDVADKFFREGTFESKIRNYFVDSSMTPLLVQENYLNCTPPSPHVPPKQRDAYLLHRASLASDFIAMSDLVGTSILRDQQWSLAPLHGALSCIAPGIMMRGTGPGRVQFPGWLGRNSTANKRQRVLREAACHMAGVISASKTEVRQAYLPALRPLLLAPLLQDGANGVAQVVETLDEYNLNKDDFDAVMELELLVGAGKPLFSKVPTNVKSALTRKYNQKHAEIQKKKATKGGERAGLQKFSEEGEESGVEDDEDEEDEDGPQPAASKAAGASGSKAAGKAKQPSKGKGKARA